MTKSSLFSQFQQLDGWLCQHRALWQIVPFNYFDLPWQQTHPELCQWLSELSSDDVIHWQNNPNAIFEKASTLIEGLYFSNWYQDFNICEPQHQKNHEQLARGIPGRKWQQVLHFDQALPLDQGRWLEWCAGKGFLGRVLSASRQSPVISLEWQEQLCEQGMKDAEQLKLPIKFVRQDAFATQSQKWVSECEHVVALHACGDLHVRLLKLAQLTLPQSVNISPCCYHLIQSEMYQAVSEAGRSSDLQLSKLDLKLPLHETVTAGRRVQKMRQVEMTYRLGFDALQRHLLNSKTYLPVPTIQKSMLQDTFENFCWWAASRKQIDLPTQIDFDHFERIGVQRFLLMEKIDLVQTIFKRSLEIWLVLDRALFLQDSGYQVDISRFCQRELTPRNILIRAHREFDR